jgi:serine/threonine protein kinase
LERWPAYDVKCDTWSFGVILFVLLGGYLPFDARGSNDTKEVFERTRNGQYHFFPQRWQGISQMAKDLIAKCLTVNPNTRISTQAALSHPWMDEGLLLSNTIISAASLAGTISEFTRPRNDKEREERKDRDVDRLKELNDDFTVFLAGREGDSIVSAMTGAGRTVGGETAVSHSFQEDSLTGKPFLHFYIKQTQLGQGSFGTVFRCVHQRTGLTYAVKQVSTSKSTKAEAATLRDEITALKYLRGAPHIIRLYDVFVEGHVTYLVLEEMKGGDLLHRILEKEVYTEREARDVCKALFSAVNFCHKKQIAHRDIKLENLLLQEADNDSSIKLADFGFAKKVKRGKSLKTMLGTLSFMAPEILNLRSQGYDERCDLWSVGVVVYALLGGYLPFEGNIKEAVMRGEYRFHDEYWRDISLPAKKLITSLLQVDPNHRISMEQSLGARWMTIDDAELSIVDLSMTKSRMQNMVTANEQLKNAVQVVSFTYTYEEQNV